MYKPTALAFMVTLVLILPAAAQKNVLPAGPQPTTWEIQAKPLDAMLNDGWFIHSVAGSDGQVLMLFKRSKFVRCYLTGPKDSMLRLEVGGMVFSTGLFNALVLAG